MVMIFYGYCCFSNLDTIITTPIPIVITPILQPKIFHSKLKLSKWILAVLTCAAVIHPLRMATCSVALCARRWIWWSLLMLTSSSTRQTATCKCGTPPLDSVCNHTVCLLFFRFVCLEITLSLWELFVCSRSSTSSRATNLQHTWQNGACSCGILLQRECALVGHLLILSLEMSDEPKLVAIGVIHKQWESY